MKEYQEIIKMFDEMIAGYSNIPAKERNELKYILKGIVLRLTKIHELMIQDRCDHDYEFRKNEYNERLICRKCGHIEYYKEYYDK